MSGNLEYDECINAQKDLWTMRHVDTINSEPLKRIMKSHWSLTHQSLTVRYANQYRPSLIEKPLS